MKKLEGINIISGIEVRIARGVLYHALIATRIVAVHRERKLK
jgi:hypothetical protein